MFIIIIIIIIIIILTFSFLLFLFLFYFFIICFAWDSTYSILGEEDFHTIFGLERGTFSLWKKKTNSHNLFWQVERNSFSIYMDGALGCVQRRGSTLWREQLHMKKERKKEHTWERKETPLERKKIWQPHWWRKKGKKSTHGKRRKHHWKGRKFDSRTGEERKEKKEHAWEMKETLLEKKNFDSRLVRGERGREKRK